MIPSIDMYHSAATMVIQPSFLFVRAGVAHQITRPHITSNYDRGWQAQLELLPYGDWVSMTLNMTQFRHWGAKNHTTLYVAKSRETTAKELPQVKSMLRTKVVYRKHLCWRAWQILASSYWREFHTSIELNPRAILRESERTNGCIYGTSIGPATTPTRSAFRRVWDSP